IFSSRRRHTRFSRDWSSDVCSSDLHILNSLFSVGDVNKNKTLEDYGINRSGQKLLVWNGKSIQGRAFSPKSSMIKIDIFHYHLEIGRASCRQRVHITVD